MAQKEKFEMTAEEVDKLGKALKNEEFMKMLMEYAEEISDPVNKERYEKEIAELEKERGSDVTFLHPKPGFVIKTYLDEEKTRKVFINICHAEEIKMATSAKAKKKKGGRQGSNWSVPYSLAPPREDVDKAKNRCTVFDVIFNAGTLDLATQNPRFRDLIIDTAFEGLGRMKVKPLKEGHKVLKGLKYKGQPQASVLRKPTGESTSRPRDDFTEKLDRMYPYKDAPEPSKSSPSPAKAGSVPAASKTRTKDVPESSKPSRTPSTTAPVPAASKARPTSTATAAREPQSKAKANGKINGHASSNASGGTKPGTSSASTTPSSTSIATRPATYPLPSLSVTMPTYKIVQRGYFDMQDFRYARDSSPGAWPKQLVVTVALPQCETMSGIELDVTERQVQLEIEKFNVDLEIPLPYAVDEEDGSATFDRSRRELAVTLNVLPPPQRQDALSSASGTDVLTVTEDDDGMIGEARLVTEFTQQEQHRSTSAADSTSPSEDLPDASGTAVPTVQASGLNCAPGNGVTVPPESEFPEASVLPEYELSQSTAEISIFFYSDDPECLHVQQTPDEAIIRWDSSIVQSHHHVTIAPEQAGNLFQRVTASVISTGVLVLLVKGEYSQQLWKSIQLGAQSSNVMAVDFAGVAPADTGLAAPVDKQLASPAVWSHDAHHSGPSDLAQVNGSAGIAYSTADVSPNGVEQLMWDEPSDDETYACASNQHDDHGVESPPQTAFSPGQHGDAGNELDGGDDGVAVEVDDDPSRTENGISPDIDREEHSASEPPLPQTKPDIEFGNQLMFDLDD